LSAQLSRAIEGEGKTLFTEEETSSSSLEGEDEESIDEWDLHDLMFWGYTEEHAREALEKTGDKGDAALDWLRQDGLRLQVENDVVWANVYVALRQDGLGAPDGAALRRDGLGAPEGAALRREGH
jgi:hypothetical protein